MYQACDSASDWEVFNLSTIIKCLMIINDVALNLINTQKFKQNCLQ